MKTNPVKKTPLPLCPNCQRCSVSLKIDGKFNLYFCQACQNGFTHPLPDSLAYYRNFYWVSPGTVGIIKEKIFKLFQKRRADWIKKSLKKGLILDVGSGEGLFAASLPKAFHTVNLEPRGSGVTNKTVIKADFLNWKTKHKFEAVCFWESLEHTPKAQEYLKKAYSLLKQNGKIFIEFPRYNCFESQVFTKNWFHLDIPRHITHLTDNGIAIILKRAGFGNIKVKGILSFEYSPWGLTASFLKSINIDATENLKKGGNLIFLVLLTPLTLISFILEFILYSVGQSPIGLASAVKK